MIVTSFHRSGLRASRKTNFSAILFSAKLEVLNDVTIIPSLLLLVLRFCTPPEVKFHGFGTSKHGEEKSISNVFFCYTYQYIVEIFSETC